MQRFCKACKVYPSDYQCLQYPLQFCIFAKVQKTTEDRQNIKQKTPAHLRVEVLYRGMPLVPWLELPASLVPTRSTVPLEGAELLVPSLRRVLLVWQEDGEGRIMVWVCKVAVAVAGEYACPAACGVFVQEYLVQRGFPFGERIGIQCMEHCAFHVEGFGLPFGL